MHALPHALATSAISFIEILINSNPSLQKNVSHVLVDHLRRPSPSDFVLQLVALAMVFTDTFSICVHRPIAMQQAADPFLNSVILGGVRTEACVAKLNSYVGIALGIPADGLGVWNLAYQSKKTVNTLVPQH